MTSAETIFWLSVVCVFYTFALYPYVIAMISRSPGRPVRRGDGRGSPVSVVLAAFNENRFVGRRVPELAKMISERADGSELIVVSDGSTDDTAQGALVAAARIRDEIGSRASIRVIELPVNRGKAVALNEGVAQARFPVVVFADARQTWAPDAIDRLMENFADPEVGAVSGDLVVESAPGVMAGVGLYWKFEKWLRRAESRFHSMVSVTGSIAAVRRELFRPIPAGTLLDDVYWPLAIAMTGRRVVHDERARAYDWLPEKARDEFRRKVRTLAGNFQLIASMPSCLLPWRNRVWWQFVSHRVLRLIAPWALIAMLVSSTLLHGPLYGTALGIQLVLLAIGLAGVRWPTRVRSPIASAAASFLVLNAAACVGFLVWATGRSSLSWSKVRYEKQTGERARGSEPTPVASVER